MEKMTYRVHGSGLGEWLKGNGMHVGYTFNDAWVVFFIELRRSGDQETDAILEHYHVTHQQLDDWESIAISKGLVTPRPDQPGESIEVG